jgi:hypothetical protein
MLVDLDHLLATPIFEAGRCSINFHPLHSYIAIAVYFILLLFKKSHFPSLLFDQDYTWIYLISSISFLNL